MGVGEAHAGAGVLPQEMLKGWTTLGCYYLLPCFVPDARVQPLGLSLDVGNCYEPRQNAAVSPGRVLPAQTVFLASRARKLPSERFPSEILPEAGGLPAWGRQPFPGYIWRIRAAQPCVTLVASVHDSWAGGGGEINPNPSTSGLGWRRRQGGRVACGRGLLLPSRGGDGRADN